MTNYSTNSEITISENNTLVLIIGKTPSIGVVNVQNFEFSVGIYSFQMRTSVGSYTNMSL